MTLEYSLLEVAKNDTTDSYHSLKGAGNILGTYTNKKRLPHALRV